MYLFLSIKLASSSVEMLQETIKLQKQIGNLKSELIQIRGELTQEKQKTYSNKSVINNSPNSDTSLDINKLLIENEKLRELISNNQNKQNNSLPIMEQMNELTTVLFYIYILIIIIEILFIGITI